MFPEVRSSVMFLGFGLKPPASGFQSYLTVASRLLHINSTIDKTSMLKMKSFSTVRDTQRSSQSYMEKRGEGDSGDQEEKMGNQKRGEQSIQ